MEPGGYKIEDFLFNASFQRYVVHKNPADVAYWESWIIKNPDALKTIETAMEMVTYIENRQKRPRHNEIKNQVFAQLLEQIELENEPPVKKNIRRVPVFFKYAALIICVIGIALAFKVILNQPKPTPDQADKFIQVIVPQGQRSQLMLPDGTRIWLNSGSILKCPVAFEKNSRDVYLEGEAFFNVKHNKDVPFIVHLKENLAVKVLGTEFNVKSYADEKIIETTLINGSIKLIRGKSILSQPSEIELKPNETATFEKDDQSINISKLVPAISSEAPEPVKNVMYEQLKNKLEPITAWKEDALVFYNESFENIAIKMERWYGVKIIVKDLELKQERFTGKFANKETIYQVLNIFNRTEPIHYISTNTEIIIEKKKNNPNH